VNVFGALFGIFRDGGLVETLREGRPLKGFLVVGTLLVTICGALYGGAMGIGVDIDTAAKDAVKVAATLSLAYLLALPVFLLGYRLLGRQEAAGPIAATVLSGVLSSSLLMGVAAPVMFFYGLSAGGRSDLLYVHVALIDVAALLGVFIMGNLAYRAFTDDRQRLIIPNVAGVIMMGLTVAVAVSFFQPFLRPAPTFSSGTDRLLDSLGIGVPDRVARALRAAALTDRIEYRVQVRQPERGSEADVSVIRAGDNYQLTVRRFSKAGQAPVSDKRIWILDGKTYNDFGGQAVEAKADEVKDILDMALPGAAFALTDAQQLPFRARAEESAVGIATYASARTGDREIEVRISPQGQTVSFSDRSPDNPNLVGRLVSDVRATNLTGATLQSSLANAMEVIRDPNDPKFRQAWETQMVVASLERPDPNYFDYLNSGEYVALRYPRGWIQRPWDVAQRSVTFQECPEAACARMALQVSALDRNKRLDEVLFEQRNSLSAQTSNRDINVRIETYRGAQVGVVEYVRDYFEGGSLRSDRTLSYWYFGRVARYNLTATAPAANFDKVRPIFASVGQNLDYLR